MRIAFIIVIVFAFPETLCSAQTVRTIVDERDYQSESLGWTSAVTSYFQQHDNFLKSKTPSARNSLLDSYADDILLCSGAQSRRGKNDPRNDLDAYLESILSRQKKGVVVSRVPLCRSDCDR